jgi:hypothetical protein
MEPFFRRPMATDRADCVSCRRSAWTQYDLQGDRIEDMCARGWFFVRETAAALCPSCRADVVRNSICNCQRLDGKHSATCRETLQPMACPTCGETNSQEGDEVR